MADDQPLISASKGSAGDAVLSRRFRRCTKAMIAHGGRQCECRTELRLRLRGPSDERERRLKADLVETLGRAAEEPELATRVFAAVTL